MYARDVIAEMFGNTPFIYMAMIYYGLSVPQYKRFLFYYDIIYIDL
jgi:hypothetical protein